MDDLIGRQQAIDALMERFKRVPTNAIIAKDTIENLPSAQPEITRCRDCVHYHTDVFGGELGLSGIWKNIIVAHNACDKWAEGMNCVTPDGFCFLAERRVKNADANT